MAYQEGQEQPHDNKAIYAPVSGEPAPVWDNPGDPDSPPFHKIPVPPLVSTSLWQESFYDPTSMATASLFIKLPSGPVDLQTGRFTGVPFSVEGEEPWNQT
jgi:hypothetical protein